MLLLALALAAAAPAPDPVREGRVIAQESCRTCHAIGKRGASPNPSAPPFRTLSSRYPLDDLAEAFAEGVFVGHPVMPEFTLQPAQVDALIAYLKSVQPKARDKKR